MKEKIMRTIIFMLSIAILVFGSIGCSVEPTNALEEQVIGLENELEESSTRAVTIEYRIPKIGIGGAIYGQQTGYGFGLAGRPLIRQVKVYAHDRIGSSHKAHLICYIDGQVVGRLDVKKKGSWLYFNVNRHGNNVSFKSVHEANKPGGDETFIHTVIVTAY